MAGLIARSPKLLLGHHVGDSDTDDDDDLSLCDLPIRPPSSASFALSSPVQDADDSSLVLPSAQTADHDDEDDPFEFFGTRHGGMCSPSAVFTGGRMIPTKASPALSTSSSWAASPLLPTTSGIHNPTSRSFPVDSGTPYHDQLPRLPPPMSRRSRSEAVRRPPREPAAYNRSASVEGRGRAMSVTCAAASKGDYRRIPMLQAAPPSTSSRKTTSSAGGVAGTTCSIDAVPSCGPRPRWYAFAAFATVKPPKGDMDINDIRTRQKKRNTQNHHHHHQPNPADVVSSSSGTRPAAIRTVAETRRRKSWLLNSLSCRVDVDALAWSPSDRPLPLP